MNRRNFITVLSGAAAAWPLAARAQQQAVPPLAGRQRAGLVTNLHRPGGNITGQSGFQVELEPKKFGLLRELRPNATTIAVLVNPNSPFAQTQISDIKAAAGTVGQEIDILNAGTVPDIDAAFARLAQMHVDAFLIATDRFFFIRTAQFVVLAARHAIPTLYFRRDE